MPAKGPGPKKTVRPAPDDDTFETLSKPLNKSDIESLPQRLTQLAKGESYSLSKRLECGVSYQTVMDTRKSMHDTARAAMGRVSRAVGYEFDGEQCDCRTTQGFRPVLVYLITRTA